MHGEQLEHEGHRPKWLIAMHMKDKTCSILPQST